MEMSNFSEEENSEFSNNSGQELVASPKDAQLSLVERSGTTFGGVLVGHLPNASSSFGQLL